MIARVAWLAATVLLYALARAAQARAKGHALVSPVVWPAAILIAAILVLGADPAEYARATAPLGWLLGPATVALAVPLYARLGELRRAWVPAACALVAGSLTAVLVAIGVAWALGAGPETLRSLAPKSVTTPIAMAIADALGGIAPLAAAAVIATGALGALFGGAALDAARVRDPRARGFAMGVAAHGMGTARALQLDLVTGTWSGVAMTLNGVLTAFALPIAWAIFAR